MFACCLILKAVLSIDDPIKYYIQFKGMFSVEVNGLVNSEKQQQSVRKQKYMSTVKTNPSLFSYKGKPGEERI